MSIATASHTIPHPPSPGATRRDFIVLAAQALAGIGASALEWPFIDSMNPSADVLALSALEFDLAPVREGQTVKVKWRGAPVFIRYRTAQDIEDARRVPLNSLPDPQTDEQRVKKGREQWLVLVGICTHLGCVPLFNAGAYRDGWFCPCHGSQYDSSGRVRKGPAPKNLVVPDYAFLNRSRIRIG